MSEIELEREMSREAVADYLRSFAAQLDPAGGRPHTVDDDGRERSHPESGATRGSSDTGTTAKGAGPDPHTARKQDTKTADSKTAGDVRTDEKVTFMVGNDSATVNPPDTVSFTVHVGNESGLVQDGTEQVSFDITWPSDEVESGDELEII